MKKINYKNVLLMGLSYLSIINCVQAQDIKAGYFSKNNYGDISIGAGKDIYTGSLSWVHLHQLGNKKQKFGIGYSLRFTSAFGKNKEYVTAPAKLTSKQSGPQVLFSKTYNENIDTFSVSSVQMNSLNGSINLQYNVSTKFSVGANIDAIGFTFGKKVTGIYKPDANPSNNISKSASPTPFNLLLVSDNDLGTLNSEFYVKYNFTDRLGLRAGYEFTFTEYTTRQKLRLENDRFRSKHQMVFVAITWHFKRI